MVRRNDWTYGSNIKDREYLEGDESFDELAERLRVEVCAVQKNHVRFVIEPKNRKYEPGDRLLKDLNALVQLGGSNLIEHCLTHFSTGAWEYERNTTRARITAMLKTIYCSPKSSNH